MPLLTLILSLLAVPTDRKIYAAELGFVAIYFSEQCRIGNSMETMTRNTLKSNGREVMTFSQGVGPRTLLLVHRCPGCPSLYLRDSHEALATKLETSSTNTLIAQSIAHRDYCSLTCGFN